MEKPATVCNVRRTRAVKKGRVGIQVSFYYVDRSGLWPSSMISIRILRTVKGADFNLSYASYPQLEKKFRLDKNKQDTV